MTRYNKAFAALVAALIPLLAALAAQGLIDGSAADTVSKVLLALVPFFAALGPVFGPANAAPDA